MNGNEKQQRENGKIKVKADKESVPVHFFFKVEDRKAWSSDASHPSPGWRQIVMVGQLRHDVMMSENREIWAITAREQIEDMSVTCFMSTLSEY